MAVKLDILLNYIFNNRQLKQQVAEINKMMLQGIISPRGAGGAIFGDLKAMFEQQKKGLEHYIEVYKNNLANINKLNKGGFFKEFINPANNPTGRRINLTKEEAEELATGQTREQILAEQDAIMAEAEAWEENRKFDERNKIQERRNQEEEARKREGERKWNIKMNKLHAQALEENKKRDEALRRKQWMLMLGRWGKLGVWGLVAQQAIKYISKAVGYAYATSMQGLDWQRTISGGAAGGSWFGQGLSAYSRAGIGMGQYQNFKRGIQGYLGSVKLGTGNAAPLMYLGLSALGNPDELERQLEKSLRRLPKDVSLALAGQMGLDYNMWEAIYSGRLDRERSAYSEEAIKEWSELARGMNELVTNINVFFFNYLAPMMGAVGEFLQRLSEGKTGIGQALDVGTGYVSRVVKVALAPIEIIFKNPNGDVIQTTTINSEEQMLEQTAKEYTVNI